MLQATVLDSVTALQTCLIGGGCDVVPGLDSDHYAFTLIMSIAGGLVFGASTRIDPKGSSPWTAPMCASEAAVLCLVSSDKLSMLRGTVPGDYPMMIAAVWMIERFMCGCVNRVCRPALGLSNAPVSPVGITAGILRHWAGRHADKRH